MGRFRKSAAAILIGVAAVFGFGASIALASPAAAVPHQVAPQARPRFTGKFELVPLFDAGHRPVIVNGHAYYAERNRIAFVTDDGDAVTVFPGATTDMASIPRLVWPLFPPDGPWAEAAAFHDACYKSQGSFVFHGQLGRTQSALYDRAGCDEILRQAMAALGVPWWPRVVIWTAVRLGGAAGWGS